MDIVRQLFDFKGSLVLALFFVLLFVVEGRRQLRKRVQSRWKRAVINTVVSIPAFSLLRFLFLPVMILLAQKSQQLQFGLAHQYGAHLFIKSAVTFLLLDYT